MNRSAKLKPASVISITASLIFLGILVLLHFLRPEIAPSWRMISEYELGPLGWIMHLAFGFFAVSVAALFFTALPVARGFSGRTGLVLLVLIFSGILLGMIFKTAAITTPRAGMDTTAMLHNTGGFLAMFFIPFTSLLLTVNLKLKTGARVLLPIVLTTLVWAAFLSFVIINVTTYKGVGGPHSPIGWPNRALIVFFLLWMISWCRESSRIPNTAN